VAGRKEHASGKGLQKEYGVLTKCEAVVCTAGMGLQKRIWRRGQVARQGSAKP
jgi:hypothetical protein